MADFMALSCAVIMVTVFAILHRRELANSQQKLWVALGISVGFALLARLARGVDWSGAAAGSVIAFILAVRDLRMFWTLLVVFAITFAATRLGSGRKNNIQTSEALHGRTASQVMANLGVAGLIAIVALNGWELLAIAALAEAAADTSSSEIGMAFPRKTVLLTTWQTVTPGMNGGISLLGTAGGLAGAVVVALAAGFEGLLGAGHLPAVIYAGFFGMLVDSTLGATLERPGRLNNDLVNLLSTAAAVTAVWIFL